MSCPRGSYTICSIITCPSPCASEPCSCPSASSGLMIVPASSTHTSDSMARRPVSRSMDTSVTTAPKLQTSRSAWK